ncbi:Phosphatidylserine/phosphatidylglycerophosphate / cardiolipin synthase [uncultured delta proteobacterium]|uniref:phospholipase D n=1 Tax=uncultured delta proteobacterium TaxID=34034 RepID=A0A212KG18_9DELT|nr:Phosphatidylserine/phosphatidylglycerophosphate / cardiolipin synthase [uncultured delta proteobacterium]SBW10682.1 Phosphatidylserine/phosphatidylglycerophosphate / cardiolipin synthase [uncultured delta proteobacterium]
MLKRTCLFTCLLFWLCVPVLAAEPLPVGAHFEVGFSPYGNAESIILNGISQAKTSIEVAAYSFTSKPISLALLDAHKRGVKVRVVADERSNTGKYSAVTFLANQGVPVRTNSNYAIFHHKFMVFDGRHVEMGSFNYSAAAADKNAENVLMLWNVPDIAKPYIEEWQRLWDESTTVTPKY